MTSVVGEPKEISFGDRFGRNPERCESKERAMAKEKKGGDRFYFVSHFVSVLFLKFLLPSWTP